METINHPQPQTQPRPARHDGQTRKTPPSHGQPPKDVTLEKKHLC